MSSHSMRDDLGLVCAFKTCPVERLPDQILRTGLPDEPSWMHFNLTDARARTWLKTNAGLPDEVQDMFLDGNQRIRTDVMSEGFFAVLGDLRYDFDGDPDGFDTVCIWVDARRVISGRRHPVRTCDALRRELMSGDPETHTSLAFFQHFIETLGRTLADLVSQLGEEVDDLEDEILAGNVRSQGETLGRIRRTLARLRRHTNANRAALTPLPRRLPGALYGSEHRQELRAAIESLDAVAQDLELVQERARLVQEEIAGRLSEATNRNLFLLSILTTTLLPVTLITGTFGMNVGGLPWLQDANGFWWVMLVMALAVAGTLFLLRKRGF